MEVTGNPDRILKKKRNIFNSWFEAWLISHAPRLMNHSKSISKDHYIKICDVVLFLKQDGVLSMALLMKLYPAKMALFIK